MATVIGKKQLLSTDLKYFKAFQGIDGKTLFQRYQLAESSIIKKYIDANYQDFLAYPVQEDNKIFFHGKKYNETPQLLSELQGEDLAKYTAIKDETLAHYNLIIDSLQNSGETVGAEFLTNAIKYVDDRFVYCYDDILVLGVWGMKLKDNERADITEICMNLVVKPNKTVESLTPPQTIIPFTINYNAGSNGNLNGNTFVNKQPNEVLEGDDIPQVEPSEGYEFIGWDENPNGYEVTDNKQIGRAHV